MKKIMFCVIALTAVAVLAAPGKVKSKRGDVDLTKDKDGGSVVCSASFNDLSSQHPIPLALKFEKCARNRIESTNLAFDRFGALVEV